MAVAQQLKGGPLANLAGRWANEPAFLEWMRSIGQPANTSTDAAEFVRARCCIESRAQLDHDSQAKARFDQYVRGPYAKFRAAAALR
ncbi:hypothetical protein WL21_32520 [Burkholderia ubonensis]|uniref:hypothetical protein n=1 Tax=Burkholderia ubonensis TaxID=101571 RepID=UPI00075B9562|nr:hypothetical protein [Burkholderia ubonensis]KVO95548.1 hypothetical protein WJ81_02745 [Burkholderia ubonensis]KVZ58471.1 hypothetical protein WL20_22395 [Burkholderia ubonensis]KVZ75135.1 hypothetical protein WL21_32520 [Burkholderia ubonensis]